MRIGLYDIDLWHRPGRIYPNLELMKTYNYLYQNNHTVALMRPIDNENDFNKIIYFKDYDSTAIPRKLNVYGDKKDIYGYGFYKSISQLKPEIHATPPSYLPYDPWTNKMISPIVYNNLKKSSYIRLETQDFSDFKPDVRNIYFADHNFLYQKGAEDFLIEHKNKHYFYFAHSLYAKDTETAIKFIRYSVLLDRRIVIDFKYDEDFFYNNYNEAIAFKTNKRSDETFENYLLRVIKTALWYKSKGILFTLSPYHTFSSKLEEYIFGWAKKISAKDSYKEYYINNKEAIKEMNNASSSIRLLLKQSPKTITPLSLDLKANL